jgi:hypothetical protein
MSKKISELPQYIGASQPTGDIPISIGGTTYKIDPSLILQIKTIEGQTLIGTGNIDLTKSNVGLSNVDNTADIDKPISTATQTALDGKEDVSNKSSSATLGTSDTLYPTQKAVKSYVDSQTTPDATTLIKGKIKLAGDLAGTADAPTVPALANKVPYIGAISDVDLGEFGLKTGNIELDTTPTNAPTTAGSIVWNDNDGTANLILKGGNVTLQIGQESVVRVVNKTATNINLLETNYQAVRVTGAQGQRLKVDLAQATTDAFSAETIGLVTETINNNQEGFITTNGLVRGVNTTGSLQGETWADGDILYLSPITAGAITKVKPIAPNHLIIIGYVIYSHATQGSIFVKVDNGYELDELHNVKIVGATNNQGLIYNSITNIWENKTIIEDAIADAVTTKAPSQNAVFDALALKQNIITNPITGTGTVNKIAKFTTSGIVGDSQIFDNGTSVGVYTSSVGAYPFGERFNVAGNISVNGSKIGFGTTDSFTLNGIDTAHYGISSGLGLTQLSGYSGLIFATLGLERMRIASSGNVGIGTSSPTAKLHVTDTNKVFDGYGNINVFTSDAPTVEIGGSIALGGTNATGGTNPYVFAKIQGLKESSASNYNGALIFGTASPSSAITEKMRITSVGNVGIGINVPSVRLHVYGSSEVSRIESSNTTLYQSFKANGNNVGYIGNGTGTVSGGNATDFGIQSNNNFVFATGGSSERMRISATGFVGIGTSSPSEKLEVNGNVLCARLFTQEIDTSNISLPIKTQGQTFMSLENYGGYGDILIQPNIGLNLQYALKPLTLPYMTYFEIFTYMSAIDGMLVFNTDMGQIWAYTGGSWNPI